ncbi:MAG: hypothetical protein ACLGIC_00330 [Acidimicrobiia bacterium]
MRRPPWLRILLLALVGTAGSVLLVAHDLAEADHVSNLLLPGREGPSVEAVTADIPEADLAPGQGHDGQQYYAIARDPTDLDEASEHLDRPRYRLQRPLFPLLAWALHPTGGGTGLVLALVVVGVVAVAASGAAAGALSTALGGGAWPALVVPALPGAYAGLRITTPDTLALALVLAAIWAAEVRRARPAIAAAVAAVLAKEAMLVLLVGHALHRRTRASVLAAATAGATAVAWWLALRVLVDTDVPQVKELTWPFEAFVAYADEWLEGRNRIGAAMAFGSFALAFVALWRRGPRHPLFGALAATTAFSCVLGASVIALDFNATRTLGPLLALAIITLGTPTPRPVGAGPPASSAAAQDPVVVGRR